MLRFSSLSEKAAVRVASFAIAGVAVLSGFCYMGWREAAEYRRSVEYSYQSAFQNLADSVADIDAALQKSVYARGAELAAALSGEISRRAFSAQTDIGALPDLMLEDTARFLAQVGDYAYNLNRQTAFGVPLTDTQTEEIRRLGEAAAQLSAALCRIQTVAREEGINIGRLLADTKNDKGGFSQTIDQTESMLRELPALIYEGQFSDHVGWREPLFIENGIELERNEAASRAADYLDIQPALLQPMGEVGGTIPSYRFRAFVDGGEIAVAITKRGGHCLSLTNSRPIGDPKVTFDEAIKIAKEYLTARGFDGMKETHYTRAGNMLIIDFAYRFDGVTYYPDIIKVGIALDNGKVCAFESSAYIMNHHYRRLPEPVFTVNEAMYAIAEGLFVSSAEICVISNEGRGEMFCYAYTCVDGDSRTFLIYVNAMTGYEENILIVLEDENGTYAI